jgi:hypothetical protein
LEKDPDKRPGDGGTLLKQIDRIIGKLERQGRGTETVHDRETDATKILVSTMVDGQSIGPGPATLAAGYVRDELHRQNRGGWFNRMLNHPAVLVPLFVLCMAGIVYGIGQISIKKHFMILIKLPSFPWVSVILGRALQAIYLREKNVQAYG